MTNYEKRCNEYPEYYSPPTIDDMPREYLTNIINYECFFSCSIFNGCESYFEYNKYFNKILDWLKAECME